MAAELRPLSEADPGALAGLLHERHQRHRAAEPLLADADAEAAVADLLARERLSGAVAVEGGQPVGYLAGQVRENRSWGTHLWVDHAAHACAGAELMRDLYAAAAPAWIDAGARLHLAMVPATADELDPWYRLGFGQMQLEAIRASGADRRPLPEGVSVRVAGLDDLERIARELGMLVWQHQQGAATFTGLEPPDLDAALASWVDDWDAASDTAFVAERGGKLLGCTVYERPSAAIGTPVDAVALAFSAVAPAARGQGVGVAMAEHSFAWASETGHGTIVVDWRVPNLLASRFWPARGFRPTFHRLHRMTVIG